MNTTEKGNELEDHVFNYLNKLIKSGALGIVEKNSKIYKQKSYSSLERGAIVFDISIEVFFEGTDTPSFIFLIECKNYKKNVPVDDIQSFADNVFQVARHNAKAICITNKGFQSGAIKTAKARKIGLWKITEDNHEIILNRRFNRKLDKPNEIELCLTDDTYLPSSYGSNFIQTPYRLTSCLIELFNDLMIDHPELLKKYQSTLKRTKVKYLSKSQISDIGESYCSKFSVNGIVNLVEIAKSESLEIIHTDSILQENIIAEINFKTQNIMIFGNQQFSNQQIRFALAHEIAHKILKHDKYFTSESQLTDKNSVGHTNILSDKDIDRLEFQANYLAACLLLPESLLRKVFNTLLLKFDIRNKGFSPLYIDDQPCNKENYHKICIPIAEYFLVSQETLKIRLEELSLAKFERSIDKAVTS